MQVPYTKSLYEGFLTISSVYFVAASLLLFVLLVRAMQSHFYFVVLVFVAAANVAGIVTYLFGPKLIAVHESRTAAGEKALVDNGQAQVVIYLILDEYMGPAGFPSDLPRSDSAIRSIEETFLQHGFTLYSNAFSHYALTKISIPSSLDMSLEGRNLETDSANEYRLFSNFADLGWGLSVYRPRSVWGRDVFRVPHNLEREVVYEPLALGSSRSLRMSFADRLSLLSRTYVARSRWISLVVKNTYPELAEVGWLQWCQPISLEVMDLLLEDILVGNKKTLFFAHLLAPHYSYVYQANGNAWPLATLSQNIGRWDGLPSIAGYTEEHRRYAAQVSHLNQRLDAFFRRLEAAGVLASATIVVHGDHGSRFAGVPDKGAPFQRLLENYSVLLAVKKPGSPEGRIDSRKGSLMTFLKEELYPDAEWELPRGVDSTYWTTPSEEIEFPFLELWDDHQRSNQEVEGRDSWQELIAP